MPSLSDGAVLNAMHIHSGESYGFPCRSMSQECTDMPPFDPNPDNNVIVLRDDLLLCDVQAFESFMK
ncbi:hypothetical protein AMC82_PD00824 (plasmid) [Rhizobium phaseoli]|nr:hypothetical protein AMC82_PD00824 [Rhizobium phaseoli]